MAKPPNVYRPVRLHTALPEDLRAKLDLYLFSEVEGRIPHGAYTEFFSARIREFFAKPIHNCPNCGAICNGVPNAIS